MNILYRSLIWSRRRPSWRRDTRVWLERDSCGFDPHSWVWIIKKNQLHAVSCTQQGRQREPSDKTLRSPLSAELLFINIFIWSHHHLALALRQKPSVEFRYSTRNASKISAKSGARNVLTVGSLCLLCYVLIMWRFIYLIHFYFNSELSWYFIKKMKYSLFLRLRPRNHLEIWIVVY